ncbi:MAG: hypothetical protein J6I65_03270 [Lachnospiraceae bacterium]|nr:hypothetical protein [Lachnospiraceae bacterium]
MKFNYDKGTIGIVLVFDNTVNSDTLKSLVKSEKEKTGLDIKQIQNVIYIDDNSRENLLKTKGLWKDNNLDLKAVQISMDMTLYDFGVNAVGNKIGGLDIIDEFSEIKILPVASMVVEFSAFSEFKERVYKLTFEEMSENNGLHIDVRCPLAKQDISDKAIEEIIYDIEKVFTLEVFQMIEKLEFPSKGEIL